MISGDTGMIISNEVQLPVMKTPLKFAHVKQPLESRLGIFYDVGKVRNAERTSSDNANYDPNYKLVVAELQRTNPGAIPPLPPFPPPLSSTGVSLRASLGTYFNLNFDYGWGITKLAPAISPVRHRGHLKVVLAY